MSLALQRRKLYIFDWAMSARPTASLAMTPSNDQVHLNVPSAWYAQTVRLTLGFINSNAGIVNFDIEAACVEHRK
jgi:hypothetical protein